MIIFQITLTSAMLQYLALLKQQEATRIDLITATGRDPRFVTTINALLRQGLCSHHVEYTKDEATRYLVYQLTPKGDAALQLAAFDLRDFLDTVRAALPAPGADVVADEGIVA